MKLLLLVTLVSVFDFNISTEIHSGVFSDDVNDSPKELTVVSSLSSGITKSTSVTLNKQKGTHKYRSTLLTGGYRASREIYSSKFNKNLDGYRNRNVVSELSDSNSQLNRIGADRREISPLALLKFLCNVSQCERKIHRTAPEQRLQKRDAVDKNDEKKVTSRGRERKAKILGRLLLNSVSSRNDEIIQDDYIEDEEDDYSKGVNRKKMNWEDYQNEDGASIMELIALNARHKTYMQHEESFY